MAQGCGGFIAGIEAALAERSDAMDRRRVAAMRCEGWDARVETFSAIISQRLGSASALAVS
jgi:hypothetical protein